jgi:hypothetical protein
MSSDINSTLVQQQLNALLGLYQHHLALFLKWITIYSTVVGAIAVYIFNQEIDAKIRRSIPLLIAAASLVVCFGCLTMWFWLKQLQEEINQLSDRLSETRYPSLLGIKMTLIAAIVTAVFAVGNIIYSLLGKFDVIKIGLVK